MKKIMSFILGFILIFPSVFSQNNPGKSGAIETAGAGVIDFLLTNPHSADKMNSTQTNALSTLGNVLSLFGQRKHEVNLATAGKNETVINNNMPAVNQGQSSPLVTQENSVIINSPDVGQATVLLDAQGKMYLMYKGNVYPISEELVNQAKEFSVAGQQNKFLEPYNLEEVRNSFKFTPRRKQLFPYPTYMVNKKEGEYLSDIAREKGVPKDKLVITYYRGKDSKAKFRKIMEGKEKITRGSVLTILKERAPKDILLPPQINFIFTCKWASDFAEDGYGFDDFQGIKNSFLKGEDFLISTGYQNDSIDCKYYLTIFDYEAGKKVFEEIDVSPVGDVILTIPIKLGEVSQGIYMVNFKIKKGDKVLDYKTEKFEIVE